MDPLVALTTFGLVALAELPDKSAVVALVLGARYRALAVWCGIAAAFVVHVTVAVLLGGLVASLPRTAVELVSSALFAVGAVLLLRSDPREALAVGTASADAALGDEGQEVQEGQEGHGSHGGRGGHWGRGGHGGHGGHEGHEGHGVRADRSDRRVVVASFGVVLVAELGDLTQVLTATLAARYDDPVSVGVGALAALWAVAGVAVVAGRRLLQVLPLRRLQQIAAVVLLVLSAVSAVSAVSALAT